MITAAFAAVTGGTQRDEQLRHTFQLKSACPSEPNNSGRCLLCVIALPSPSRLWQMSSWGTLRSSSRTALAGCIGAKCGEFGEETRGGGMYLPQSSLEISKQRN